MLNGILSPARTAWEGLQERLFFLPPFPDELDSLALFSMLLVVGLLFGEWLRAKLGWPKVIGYVLAGTLFGPSMLGWISIEALAQIRPMADAALGLLMLEIGRRLDLRWLGENRDLLRATLGEISLSFTAIFLFAWGVVGLMAAWAAAAAAVTMASAPAVVLLTVEESNAQGQVSERIILHTALSAAASFVVFAVVVGVVHAQYSDDWLNAVAHPPWVVVGSVMIAWLMALLARLVAALLRKRSLAQVFILVATALLAVGTARMLAVPVFLTLFLMGVILSFSDQERTLSYTNLPEGHWLLAIILFVVVGASLPWQDFTWLIGLQAIGLLIVRAVAKVAALAWAGGGGLGVAKRVLVGIGIQPLSATAVFMAYEIAGLYPEIGRSSLSLPLFAAAIMELAGPALCRFALVRSGETAATDNSKEGVA
ncbi:cation:proton antiporter [Candidatus Accumulibacter vicinus]|uniref:Transporter, monovalent cation:proton antiporter-2 (CPA2) family n=1 Tax=Candidatus Accumulibacter vicinus TaxID=2954382 RepID=A0A084XVL2_9PROT|nr:cation:proton antiporter [Candidatus Accumulibacter vicinus]KFB66506.1 MAG: transporter, monovalent cation:proton antiporter-2 (CPA2) family [Candidatus Accumulibacter vicinus]